MLTGGPSFLLLTSAIWGVYSNPTGAGTTQQSYNVDDVEGRQTVKYYSDEDGSDPVFNVTINIEDIYDSIGPLDYDVDMENVTWSFGNLSLNDIPEIYRGVFFSRSQTNESVEETEAGDDVFDSYHSNTDLEDVYNTDASTYNVLPGDGDQCCATEIRPYPLPYLDNRLGRRYIVSLADACQYIPVGACVRDYGICHGRSGMCTTVNIRRMVLVWTDPDSSPPFAFEWFDIPNHCSCRNAVPVDDL